MKTDSMKMAGNKTDCMHKAGMEKDSMKKVQHDEEMRRDEMILSAPRNATF